MNDIYLHNDCYKFVKIDELTTFKPSNFLSKFSIITCDDDQVLGIKKDLLKIID